MNKLILCLALWLLALPAAAQVVIDQPWTRATAPGAKVAGGYMTIKNAGAADKLVGASTLAAARIELHVHINDNGVMKMRESKGGYDIPAKGAFELKPGGAHLMFIDLKRPFKEGEKVPVRFKFEKAGDVNTEFQVGGLGSASAPVQHKH